MLDIIVLRICLRNIAFSVGLFLVVLLRYICIRPSMLIFGMPYVEVKLFFQ